MATGRGSIEFGLQPKLAVRIDTMQPAQPGAIIIWRTIFGSFEHVLNCFEPARRAKGKELQHCKPPAQPKHVESDALKNLTVGLSACRIKDIMYLNQEGEKNPEIKILELPQKLGVASI